jgi:hypothetical protein
VHFISTISLARAFLGFVLCVDLLLLQECLDLHPLVIQVRFFFVVFSPVIRVLRSQGLMAHRGSVFEGD